MVRMLTSSTSSRRDEDLVQRREPGARLGEAVLAQADEAVRARGERESLGTRAALELAPQRARHRQDLEQREAPGVARAVAGRAPLALEVAGAVVRLGETLEQCLVGHDG